MSKLRGNRNFRREADCMAETSPAIENLFSEGRTFPPPDEFKAEAYRRFVVDLRVAAQFVK